MAWEDELGAELSDETWDRCLTAIRSCSVNRRHQLIQFKVIHRLHYTKTKLHNIFSSVSPFCDKCKVTEDTTAHAFWYCPSLSGFWTSIFDWYSKAYNRPLLLDVELAIFGFSQHTSTLFLLLSLLWYPHLLNLYFFVSLDFFFFFVNACEV